MAIIVKKGLYLLIFFLLSGIFFVQNASAASLTNVADTITTSRPSAAAPLTADQAATAGSVQIFDNGSVFLASDSATLFPDPNGGGETLNTVNIASMSATGVPSATNRMLYFTNTATNVHHKGDAIVVPITALHTIRFTTISSIPASGHIVITFPGSAQNTASASATTFSFNNLTSTQVQFNNVTCGSVSISSPTIDCTVNASGVAGGVTVTVLVGCTTQSAGACTAQAPRLINPTKTAASGTADIWKVAITTQDSSAVTLDSAKASIGTIESVQVQAQVDPTLTFTIAAVSGAINTGNTTGCTNTEAVNSGIASTTTNINLGLLSTATINIAAQLITISTNASNGYALTATSSGHLINAASGVWIPDSTTPGFMTVNVPWFGIHACGLNVSAGTWGTGATGGGAGAKYGWPTQTSSLTLASAASGPIGNTAGTGGVGAGLTSVEYAAAVDVTVPAGIYTSVVTYVATPTF